jgi:hypothetical protein
MKTLLNALLLATLFIVSCQSSAPLRDTTVAGPNRTAASIEVIPWAILITSGDTKNVYVTILDRNGNPVPNQPVSASIEAPFVAVINDTAVTNADGVALFTATGLGFADKSTITFTSDGLSYTLDVWNAWYKNFSGGGY